jgi:hypothetical protein
MNFLTLSQIKKQCIIDEDFTDDDEYLTMIGDSAEQFLEDHLNRNLFEVAGDFSGELPPSLQHALRMLVDYFYSTERGSSGNDNDIPKAFFTLTKNYCKENLA